MSVEGVVVVVAHQDALLEEFYVFGGFGVGEEVAGGEYLSALDVAAA